MSRWRAPVLLVGLAALAGFAFAQWYAAPPNSTAQLATEQRLMCPQCTSTRLDVCDRPICQDMKSDIARRLTAGESTDSIVDAYRAAYGPAVVSASQTGGLAVLAPGLLVAVGLLALVLALRRRAGTAGRTWSSGK